MTNYITKFRSLDGLILYEFRAYKNRDEYITRNCVIPVRLTPADSPYPETSQLLRRVYRIHDEYFDEEKGMFVREYREEYRP